jgi:hypothetical protein
MNAYILNGLPPGGYFDSDSFNSIQGTNQVVPMQGTNQVVPMQGTNQVVPMQGTNQVVPMQGSNGQEYYVSPIVLIDEEDVPLQGMPADYTSDDVQAYQLAYMMGDTDALNGLFSKVKERRSGRKEERAARKEARRATRDERRALRTERIRQGGTFLDKVADVGGGFLKKAAGIADQTAEALDDLGIGYDPEILEQRSFVAADQGADASMVPTVAPSGGIMGWWNARSNTEKLAIGAGVAVGGYLAYKQFFAKKGRRK